jgi:hypothetical protein
MIGFPGAGILIVTLVVAGSLWIMSNLNDTMMPLFIVSQKMRSGANDDRLLVRSSTLPR